MRSCFQRSYGINEVLRPRSPPILLFISDSSGPPVCYFRFWNSKAGSILPSPLSLWSRAHSSPVFQWEAEMHVNIYWSLGGLPSALQSVQRSAALSQNPNSRPHAVCLSSAGHKALFDTHAPRSRGRLQQNNSTQSLLRKLVPANIWSKGSVVTAGNWSADEGVNFQSQLPEKRAPCRRFNIYEKLFCVQENGKRFQSRMRDFNAAFKYTLYLFIE